MTTSSKHDRVPESDLRDYLLGRIGGEACEQLDELSVCDDAFADRLSAAEHDLVDAYVRNELLPKDRTQFESYYMSTRLRRDKVSLASALYTSVAGVGSMVDDRPSAIRLDDTLNTGRPGMCKLRAWWQTPKLGRALTRLLLFASLGVWLAITNDRLRTQSLNASKADEALKNQYRQPQAQAGDQRSPNEHGPEGQANTDPDADIPASEVSSLFLPPPTRSAEAVPAASLATADRWLELKLGLESDEYHKYLGQNSIWRTVSVKSINVNHRPAIAVLVPAETVRKRGRYRAEVCGIPADGQSELLGEYVFQVDAR